MIGAAHPVHIQTRMRSAHSVSGAAITPPSSPLRVLPADPLVSGRHITSAGRGAIAPGEQTGCGSRTWTRMDGQHRISVVWDQRPTLVALASAHGRLRGFADVYLVSPHQAMKMSEEASRGPRVEAPLISVVLPTRSRPESLARAVNSVLASDHVSFELIVVDQSDDERSREVVEAADDRRVVFVRDADRGKSRALNLALTVARGELVAFTDDDCVVAPDWLAQVESTFSRDADAGLLFGHWRAAPHDPLAAHVPTFHPPGSRRLTAFREARFDDSYGAPGGGNMAARRALFGNIGPFDPCLTPGGPMFTGDDTDILHRALHGGFAVLYEPACLVTHWGARQRDGGAAARLVREARFARGAILAKDLRLGERIAAVWLIRMISHDLFTTMANLLRARGMTGVGRLLYTVRGFLAGLRQPLDRERGVFRCSTAGH